jgi:glutathione peroxidase
MKMKILITTTIVLLGLGLVAWNLYGGISKYDTPSEQSNVDFYSLSCKTLEGEDFSFEQLRGKRVLIVNTASKCGFTPQYKELQELHETYGGESFVILGFPCNDFGKQEPGSSEKIKTFCQKNYGVEFAMMEKVSVKGEAMSEVYVWLNHKTSNGVSDHHVRWNFHKFLIDENGHLSASLKSGVKPLSQDITDFASGKPL